MNIHKNASMTPRGRAHLIGEIARIGLKPAATAAGLSGRTARKWQRRWTSEGTPGFLDRGCRPGALPSARRCHQGRACCGAASEPAPGLRSRPCKTLAPCMNTGFLACYGAPNPSRAVEHAAHLTLPLESVPHGRVTNWLAWPEPYASLARTAPG